MAKTPTSRPRKPAIPAGSRPFIAEPQAAAAASGHDVHGAPVVSTGPGTISSNMDYAAHEAMYHRFTGMVKWGIISSIVVVLFLFIVIHPMVTVAS